MTMKMTMCEFVHGLSCEEGCKLIAEHLEIVRCKDCKFYEPDGISSAVYPDRFWCAKMLHYMQSDGFCAWGERRDA